MSKKKFFSCEETTKMRILFQEMIERAIEEGNMTILEIFQSEKPYLFEPKHVILAEYSQKNDVIQFIRNTVGPNKFRF